MSNSPKALILTAPGINCNAETGFAVEQAGGQADQVHINQLYADEVRMEDYQMLFLSGGFSHGDDISSGRILGLELRTRFAEQLNQFVTAGKAVVGICNGYQVLVESGLLPNGEVGAQRNKTISLVSNANNTFESRWNRLRIEDSVCKFMPEGLIGEIIELPSAHQEGRHEASDSSVLEELTASRQVAFRFVDSAGEPTEVYPENPNGSPAGITGICDKSGVILGLMPHPERAIFKTQHPNWRRGEGENPFGSILFQSIVDYARDL